MLVELNKHLFRSRVKRIYDGWNSAKNDEDYSSIAEADALLLVAGDPASEDEPMRKSTCLQQWLLGYEFPSTLFLFEKDKILILCSASKAKILAQIENSAHIPIEILAQAKGKDVPSDALPKFADAYASKQRVGALTKETHTGRLIGEWEKAVNAMDRKPELVDMSTAVSCFMAVKDSEELKNTQVAAALTSTLLKHHVAPKLESILDKEAKVSHEVLSAQIEARLGSGEGSTAKGPDMKVWSKGKGLNDVDWQLAEFCYPPIIISRSSKTGYDLRYTVESTDDSIAHKGVLLVAFGLRYKSYCANVGRTFIVDPHPDQETQYNLLLTLQSELLSIIKDGVSARDVYQFALSFVKKKDPDLEKHFVKNVGFGMGIEFRDSAYVLSAKNGRVLKADMILNLGLGFTDLVDSTGKKYSLHLVDTIRVGADKSVLLTEGARSTKDTLFFLTPESEEEKPKKERNLPVVPRANGSPQKKTAGTKVLRTQTRRAARDEVHLTAAARLAEHQRELHERLQAEGLQRYSEGGGAGAGKEGKGWKKFQSYKGEAALPPEVERLRIFVDRKAQTVILPMHGSAVPFHINTIKNVSKSDEGEFTILRINFQTPGQLAGKKEDTPFEDPDATFIRSVSYRSPDSHRFDNLSKQITELKKEANKREQQKKEMADVVEQGTLVEIKGRRPAKMSEAFVRPALDGKRLPGEVEVHQNGVRYQSPLGQKIDILFSNIKHLFFQPCDYELLVIVHLHLKSPIMIGKKKTFDVQFFREATDVQFDETGNRKRKHRYGDEDEIEMEQQERKRRAMLNKEIKAFAEKIAEQASTSGGETLELDIPFRELSFEGVPFRTSARLQPTTECLVHLTDPPFLVVTLADIEIASLERVQYGLKQFDLVFIFKDFTKPPLHINSIQSSQMDDVKNWLDSVDIPMSEGPVNLNWGPIMKHINENPYEFFQGGGWSFLGGAGGAESDRSEGSESESEFEADEEELAETESTEESDYEDSDVGSDSDEEYGDEDESEGEDWDELERKAAKSDMKRAEAAKKAGHSDDSDEDRGKKSKSKSKTVGNANGKPKKR
ncbi:putative fact complex subunit spt16 [Lyophyllum shimeji]|uniref:FACT complex subunit n=1 Tax=Lyophyllum shimeji TaxID=47721 RepID=A0A9P3PGV3_LYOSH|nr:putative fact complex subunit spt16 [Lyophyllum shimeji]